MSSSIFPTQSRLNYNFTSGFAENTTPPLVVADDSVTPLRWFLVEVVGAEDTEENLRSWSSFIGICIAIAGNALISLALNIQKYSHTRLQREAERRRMGRLKPRRIETGRDGRWSMGIDEEEEEEEQDDEEDEPLLSRTLSRPSRSGSSHRASSPHEQSMLLSHFEKDGKGNADVSYMTSPYWWLGLTIMFFGEAGNFLAYGFAPASIVSPLGVVALISNCVVAPVMLKEPFRRRDVLGVLVSIAGAVVVVLSAEKEETKLGPDEILDAISQTAFEIYFAVTCVLILVLMQLSSRFGHKTIVIDLGLVALFGAYTVLSTKGISSLISSSFYHIFQYPIAYLFAFVLVSTAVLQVKYINRALQRFDSTQVIPTQFVLFTISVIVGSAILYRDFETVNRERMLKFITGCSLTFVGVYLISSQRQSGSSKSSFTDDESIHDNEYAEPISRASNSRLDGGISIPASPTFRPSFSRVVPPSNATSHNDTPSFSTSPEAIARGLQTAAADPLLGETPLRKRTSESESMRLPLGFMPGSNLVTGYQLQTVIAERVNGSLGRARSRAEGEEESEGLPARRSSISLVMDFVKGKRKAGDEAVDEDGDEGSVTGA
ncbi:DUF803-domain-containing protein [Wilcoxina mikolae CBS 423.85]|nr:DUF803-domain-containing protein [Wilcoxina mikolae CBS 423.85]